MTENADAKQKKHLFQPGQSGNPAGKPKGARHKATQLAEALINGQAQEIVQTVVAQALAGDGPLLRALLDRLVPPRKDGPVKFKLPDMSDVSAMPVVTAALLAATAEGRLTPTEAEGVSKLVEAHRKAVETAELETRVAALEAGRGG